MSRQRTREREVQELAPFLQTDAGVSFVEGVMHVAGRPQRPTEVQHWKSTNELSQYTTVVWQDPLTGERRSSCNCPGWFNKKAGKKRSCCHTKHIEGTAICDRVQVDLSPIRLHTVRDVEQHVETVKGVRELRAIMLD